MTPSRWPPTSRCAPPNSLLLCTKSLAPTQSLQSTGWRGPRQKHEPQRQCAGWRGPTLRRACNTPFGGRRAVRPTPAAAAHRLNLHRTTQFRSSISSDTALATHCASSHHPSNSLTCQVRGDRLAHQSSVYYPSRAASLDKRGPRHARPGARPVAAADAPSLCWRLLPGAMGAILPGHAHDFAAAADGGSGEVMGMARRNGTHCSGQETPPTRGRVCRCNGACPRACVSQGALIERGRTAGIVHAALVSESVTSHLASQ